MEIIKPCVSLLSNYEVMEVLRDIKDTKMKYSLRHLATVAYEGLQYLEDSPCKYQSRDAIVEFIKEIKPYNITANECLMMVNDPPTSPLHIQLLIADSEERLTEEQVAEILNITQKYFPGPLPENN